MSDTKNDLIKAVIIICVLLVIQLISALALFFPVKSIANDGGSAVWSPVTGWYKVWELHRISDEDGGYLVGTAVELFGIEVYNDGTIIYD